MQTLDTSTYNDWHRQYEWEDDTQSIWHLFVKNNLSNRDVEGKVLLEIACGRGGLSNWIAKLKPPCQRLYACDFSAVAVKIAQSRFGSHANPIDWSQQDIQALQFRDNYFDTIISCETIEHVPDPARAVNELYRVLKKGGRVYLTCPNYFNFFGLYCIYRKLIGKPYTEGQPYVNYLLLPRLLHWAKTSGFTIKMYYTTDLILPLRAHFHFFENRIPRVIRWLGFRTFFILEK
ncbi:MAG: class I SAM-dependent methyltransferase [Cytophagales bacterium]